MIQSAIPTSLSLNIGGRLLSLDHPRVMGILNATPDSFYAGSRCGNDETIIANRARAIIEEGGDMIDVGAYSSRPDATDIPLEEEWQRLDRALSVIRGLYPDAILSVDTFRAEIARRSVERHGVQIINDISGGELDKTMFETVASLHVPYILMHMRGTPQTMQQRQSHGRNHGIFRPTCRPVASTRSKRHHSRSRFRIQQNARRQLPPHASAARVATTGIAYPYRHFPEIDDLQTARFFPRRKPDGDNRSQYHRPDGRYSHFTGT